MQDSYRDSDIQNRIMDTRETGEGGANWDRSIEMCTLPHVK